MDLADRLKAEVRSLRELIPPDDDPVLESIGMAILLEDVLGIDIPEEIIVSGIGDDERWDRVLLLPLSGPN